MKSLSRLYKLLAAVFTAAVIISNAGVDSLAAEETDVFDDGSVGLETAAESESSEASFGEEVVSVTGVSLSSPDSKTKELNYRFTMDTPGALTAAVAPSDASEKGVTFTSSDELVAKVDENGVITLEGVGVATITATTADGGFQDQVSVTVRYATPAAKEQGENLGGLDAGGTYKIGTAAASMTDITADGAGLVAILPEWRNKTITIIRTDAENAGLNSDAQTLKINKKAAAYDEESGVTVAWEDNFDTLTYTGQKLKPRVSVFNATQTFAEKTDYIVTYKKNVNVGTARVILRAAKNSRGLSKKFKVVLEFEIVPHDISSGVEAPTVYINGGKKAKPFLLFGKKNMTAGKDFTYTAQTFDTDGSFTVEGKGNFTGELSVDVHIRTPEEKARKFKVKVFKGEDYTPLTYDGTEQYPDITVYYAKDGKDEDGYPVTTLSEGTDYLVGWPMNCTDAGSHKYTVYGIGQYSGSVTKSYKIRGAKLWDTKEDIDWPTMPPERDDDGKMMYEEIAYYPGGVTINGDDSLFGLEKGEDYSISYSNNKGRGVASYTVTFKKNYGRTKSITGKFKIVKASISSDAQATMYLPPQLYGGTPGVYASAPYIICDNEKGSMLKKGKDFSVRYYLDKKCSETSEITKSSPVTDETFNGADSITVYARAFGKGDYDAETYIDGSYVIYKTAGVDPVDLGKDVKVVCRSVEYKGDRIAPSPDLIESVRVRRGGEWYDLSGEELDNFKNAVTVDFAGANNLNAGSAALIVLGKNTPVAKTPFFYGGLKTTFKIKKTTG